MNYRMIIKSLGALLAIEAVCMLPALAASMACGDSCSMAFTVSILALVAASLAMNALKPKTTDFYTRDGFALVGAGWLATTLLGALPYLLGGVAGNAADAVFESVSGFTTTGASVVPFVEQLPKSIVLWRSITNWMGGMGVLVLMMAVMPSVRASGIHIMEAEAPGPYVDKFTPRMGWVAKILYSTYVLITAAEIIFLKLGGMPLFDAVTHSMSTVSTGGYSSKNMSVGAYGSAYMEIVVTVFMLACGVNLSLYQALLRGKLKSALKDEETRLFLAIVFAAAILISIDLVLSGQKPLGEAFRAAAFQVASVITSTCFYSADYSQWPGFSRMALLLLMFVGGCAGSTAGGLKCVRVLLMAKAVGKDVSKLLHPSAVQVARLNGRAVDGGVLSGAFSFSFIYMLIIAVSSLILSLDGLDAVSSVSACISCVGNMGAGFGAVGPAGNYAAFSALGKAVLSVCMLLGRLEIYPVLILFMPAFWKQVNK